MSIFDRNSNDTPLAKIVNNFKREIAQGGTEFVSPEQTKQFLSMESLSEPAVAELERHGDELSRLMRTTYEDAGIENLKPFQLEAGLTVAFSSGNPSAYHERAIRTDVVSSEGIDVIEAEGNTKFGNFGFVGRPAVEAFDNQEIDKHVPYSITFNIQASRQDEFGEAFYPTAVVTPDQAGLDIHIDRTLVMNEQKHTNSGKARDWNRITLIDGIQDHRILDNNAVSLVPSVAEDNSNLDKFVDLGLVAPKEVLVNNIPVKTAPLKMGIELDYLGISENPGLIGAGVMDSTDSIDARIGLKELYMSMSNDVPDGAGGTTTVNEVVKFPVQRMIRSDFVKSPEHDHREMTLVFNTRDLSLDSNTKTVGGAEPQLTKALRDNNLLIRLKTNVNGTVNLETANGIIHNTPILVDAVFEKNPATGEFTELDYKGAVATAAINSLGKLEMIGYTINATRSNQNLRTRGLLLNINRRVERYTVPLGSPFSVPAPISSDRTASDLAALITAARIRISNNAVTSLLSYADTLKEYVKNLPTHHEDGLAIEGIGRYLITPFYEELYLDLSKELNSISSHERNADVKALLIDSIREIAYRMYRDSNYQAALDALTGTSGQKPTLVVGTDRTLANHMQVIGDSRTAGIDFDHQIVSSDDSRMFGNIVFSFVRPNVQGGDALSFGTHAWIPELTSTTQLTRQGATVREVTVQPRSRHVNTLPIMGVIKVDGLDVLRERVQSDATVTP